MKRPRDLTRAQLAAALARHGLAPEWLDYPRKRRRRAILALAIRETKRYMAEARK